MPRPLYNQLVPYYEFVEGRDWNAEIKLLVSILRKTHAETVIDLGCGPGYHVRVLAKRGFRMTGIDISRQNITYARKRAREQGVNPRFIVGSYYDYRPDQRVDASLCLNWSIPTRDRDLRRFLHNTRSILRTGGIVIFDYERTSEIVWKDVGKPIVNSWSLKQLTIVRVSIGYMISNVLYSRDAYLLYPKGKWTTSPDEVMRYKTRPNASVVTVYVDTSYVRFFSIPELRRFAKESGFQLIGNYVLPRNGYRRNYAVLKKL